MDETAMRATDGACKMSTPDPSRNAAGAPPDYAKESKEAAERRQMDATALHAADRLFAYMEKHIPEGWDIPQQSADFRAAMRRRKEALEPKLATVSETADRVMRVVRLNPHLPDLAVVKVSINNYRDAVIQFIDKICPNVPNDGPVDKIRAALLKG